MAKLVSKTYGDALFAVASEEGRMDEFFEAAVGLTEVLRTNEDFGKLMSHPKIMQEDKVKIIEETFDGRIPKEMLGLMTLMVTKRREEDFLAVFDYFVELVKEEKKIGKADVKTAIPLSNEQKTAIEEKLLATTKYESFEMNYEVDASLIGGMIVRIGDRVIDSSIQTKLNNLSRELRSIQV